MAEVVAVVGALSATAQLLQYTFQFATFINNWRSDIQNGLKTVSEETGRLVQFMEIVRRAKQDVYMDPTKDLLDGCLEDASQLHKILENISKQPGDWKLQVAKRSIKRMAKDKNIRDLYSGLQMKQTNLSLAITLLLPKMLEQVAAIHSALPELMANVSALPSLTSQVSYINGALQPLLPAMPTLVSSTRLTISPRPLVWDEGNCIRSSVTSLCCGLSTMSLERRKQFIGQKDLLEKIRERLEYPETHNRLALYGIGGIGKSETAFEYALQTHKRDPKISLFWIHASNDLQIETDFLKIGISIQLFEVRCTSSDKMTEAQEAIYRIKHWLSTEAAGQWVIIVDDYKDNLNVASVNLLQSIPQSTKGSVIFTTRNKCTALEVAGPSNALKVEPLEMTEAKKLLLSHIGLPAFEQEEAAEASELLQSLDFLSLAISQAGAFIAKHCLSVRQYHELYKSSEQSRVELLHDEERTQQQRMSALNDSSSSNSVKATLRISYEQIVNKNEEAAHILALMVCLAPQEVPRDLLTCTGKVKLERALGLLKAYCLISEHPSGSLRAHSLVYLIIRDWLKRESTWGEWLRKALSVVTRMFPIPSTETLATCDQYLPHAEAILCYEVSADISENCALLASRCSHHLRLRGRYGQAETFARRAVECSSKAYREIDLRTLTTRSDLATILRLEGQIQSASIIDKEVLGLRTEQLGELHQDSLKSMNNYGLTLQDLGKYNEAVTIHKRALKGRKQTLGQCHSDTLSSMTNLSRALQQNGDLEAAKILGQEAVRLKQLALGHDHFDTLLSINNLAIVLQLQHDFEGAHEKHLEVLSYREKILGRQHPKTLISICNLGLVLYKQSRYAAAEAMLREAMNGYVEALGVKHPETLTCISNLSLALRCQKKYHEAERLCRQALKTRQAIFEEGHPAIIVNEKHLRDLVQLRNQQSNRPNDTNGQISEKNFPVAPETLVPIRGRFSKRAFWKRRGSLPVSRSARGNMNHLTT